MPNQILSQRVQDAVRDALATTTRNPGVDLDTTAAFVTSAALAEVHRQPAAVIAVAALRNRIVDALVTTRRTDYEGKADHRQHRYDARCALCAADVDALTDAVLAVLPSADRASVLREAADAVFALDYDNLVSEQDDENLGSRREAWDLGTIHASQLLRRMADETATTETQPDFFQPGRTYTSGTASTLPPAPQWTFQVATVARSPRGDRVALGFLTGATYGCGVWTPHGEYDMAGWTAAGVRKDGAQP